MPTTDKKNCYLLKKTKKEEDVFIPRKVPDDWRTHINEIEREKTRGDKITENNFFLFGKEVKNCKYNCDNQDWTKKLWQKLNLAWPRYKPLHPPSSSRKRKPKS